MKKKKNENGYSIAANLVCTGQMATFLLTDFSATTAKTSNKSWHAEFVGRCCWRGVRPVIKKKKTSLLHSATTRLLPFNELPRKVCHPCVNDIAQLPGDGILVNFAQLRHDALGVYRKGRRLEFGGSPIKATNTFKEKGKSGSSEAQPANHINIVQRCVLE